MISSFSFKLIMMAIMFTSMFYGFTYQHEAVHQKIYEDYGIESEVHWKFSLIYPAYTSASYMPSECPIECRLAHEQNEIVGYNVISLIGTVMAIFFLYTIYQEIDKVDKLNG